MEMEEKKKKKSSTSTVPNDDALQVEKSRTDCKAVEGANQLEEIPRMKKRKTAKQEQSPSAANGTTNMEGKEPRLKELKIDVQGVATENETPETKKPKLKKPKENKQEQSFAALSDDKVVPFNQDIEVSRQKASVSHGRDVNSRHTKQLESLSALMSAKRRKLKGTDEKDKVLKRDGCSSGLYMEWEKEEDRYFLWGRIAQEKLLIKFEFHGGFEEAANDFIVQNPLFAFSEAFDHGDGWKEVKMLLQQLFRHPKTEESHENHDCIFAFTRSAEILHFRIFKLHTKATSCVENLRLQEVSPSFTLKPLELHSSGEIEDEHTKHIFLDEDRLMFECKKIMSFVSHAVVLDGSSLAVIPHVLLQLPNSPRVMLPQVDFNRQWLGYNTTYNEYFERYAVFSTTDIPGTGPIPASAKGIITPPTPPAATPLSYAQITISMKFFSRGLITCVGDTHKRGACYRDFKAQNIFLKVGRVVILGVKLERYSPPQALKNLNSVHDIILHRLDGTVPPDVHNVLDILLRSPIDNFALIANNYAWMDPKQRENMLTTVQEHFFDLPADMQVAITKSLPEMDKWLQKFAKNWLLYTLFTERMPPKQISSFQDLENYLKVKSLEVQSKAVDAKDKLTIQSDHLQLYNGRRYVKGIRNSYVHLPETYKEKKLGELTEELVDLVVSSEHAAACSYLQVQVPKAFKDTNEKRASYDTFNRYFVSVDSIGSNTADEKTTGGVPCVVG